MQHFADWYCEHIYSRLSASIGGLVGLLPFSLSEITLYAIFIYILYRLVRIPVRLLKLKFRRECAAAAAAEAGSFLKTVLITVLILFVVYELNCGINYRCTSFAEKAGLVSASGGPCSGEPYSTEELYELCAELAEGINTNAVLLKENGMGSCFQWPDNALGTAPADSEKTSTIPDASADPDASGISNDFPAYDDSQPESTALSEMRFSVSGSADFTALGKEARQAMERLGETFADLSGSYPYPKPFLISRLLTVQQVTGIYLPVFIEANYNREIPNYNLPFTACHELAHLRGIMREDEDNFIGYLACINSDDIYFRYSGYMNAWVYAGNELYKSDKELYRELYATLCEEARNDLKYNNSFWDKYETKTAEAHEKLNDTYLKLQGQSGGIRTYDYMVKLMLEYRRQTAYR